MMKRHKGHQKSVIADIAYDTNDFEFYRKECITKNREWVQGYTRKDGTRVHGYCKSKYH